MKDPAVIVAPKVADCPPNLPTPSPSTDGIASADIFYLPPKRTCDYYVSRFLEDVHSTYWFYSIESFLHRVENTYSESSAAASSSWMCSMYSIFAIGAADSNLDPDQSSNYGEYASPPDEKTSTDYLTLAKQLIPAVYDEAELDSIRALAIMVSKMSPSAYFANLC